MSSIQGKSLELPILMDLRLAFGPGTRLWALRSREELCYDWLSFKASVPDASIREFALRLYAHEKANARETQCILEIRRRIAIVVRTYRIRRRQRSGLHVSAQSRTNSQPAKSSNQAHLPALVRNGAVISALPIRESSGVSMDLTNEPC